MHRCCQEGELDAYEAYKDLWRALRDRLAGFNFTRQLLNIFNHFFPAVILSKYSLLSIFYI